MFAKHDPRTAALQIKSVHFFIRRIKMFKTNFIKYYDSKVDKYFSIIRRFKPSTVN